MPPASPPAVLPERLRYVAVEGVIGAGKTTLARMLARRADARLVLERFDENPFLPAFYADPARWAFQTQLAFLASRFGQQKDLAARDLFQQQVVADYTFDKDRIFAHVTLSGDELQLYETLFSLMEPNAPVPDLVVYLRSPVDRLVHNVALRGRAYEADMDAAYLAELTDAYDRHFAHYQKGPLLVIDAGRIDFVRDAAAFEELVRQIADPPSGTRYFNPPPSLQLDFG
ncbi:MAG: deoxynucleoside kinase [Rubricoccaceae bacterium]|nr:deoxynucleoside kinase [Rubricoccaceae bacterium]